MKTAPGPTPAPVTIELETGPKELVFNLATLIRVEQRLNLATLDVARQVAAYMPSPGPDGEPRMSGEKLMAARLIFMLEFVAACADLAKDEAVAQVPVDRVFAIFYRVALAYLAAAMELAGLGDDGGKGQARAGTSDGSAPGPTSSSGSAEESSTGSGPASSPA